ncbi:MAG: glycosyltransferase [Bacteroidota bacterium]
MKPKTKKAIVAVTNDLITDQRVNRSCLLLKDRGYEVCLVGRQLNSSPKMDERSYATFRFKLLFNKGPMFYASYNLRLFLFLMTRRTDLIFSNDLDTLVACWLASIIKGNKLVYDTHEYFTGVPELMERPMVRRIWKSIESFIFPKLKTVITVNDSIAKLYRDEYGNQIHVVRNVPMGNSFQGSAAPSFEVRSTLGIGSNDKVIILQGSGINRDRGAEETVMAMKYLEHVKLILLGGGDSLPELKRLSVEHGVSEKVLFLPRMPYAQMMQYTAACDLGLTLDKDTNINYRFSLPNKIFDYVRAGIPILASRLPEVEKIISGYDIGTFIRSHEPMILAEDIRHAIEDKEAIARHRKNLQLAALELTWENETKNFPDI